MAAVGLGLYDGRFVPQGWHLPLGPESASAGVSTLAACEMMWLAVRCPWSEIGRLHPCFFIGVSLIFMRLHFFPMNGGGVPGFP